MGNRLDKLIDGMKTNPQLVRFSELEALCQHYVGKARKTGSGHCVYKTPWHGDPRINIQHDHAKAKVYQVKQVLLAIEKLLKGG